MGFLNYRDALSEALVETAETSNALSESFKVSDLVKVGTLITKMATRKLGVGKFTYIYSQDFKKSTGESGTGALFVSEGGVQMRFNFLRNAKKSYSVNSIDYWKKGKKIGDSPSKSISFMGENILKVTDQLFDFLRSGKLDESTDGIFESFESIKAINESTPAERRKQRAVFAAKHGLEMRNNTIFRLRQAAEAAGKVEEFEAEFGGVIEVNSNVDEVTNTETKTRTNQKQLDDATFYADPEYVFTDMEEAAKVVARGKWRSAIFAGMGGIGKTYGVKQVLTQELGPYAEGPDGKWMFYEGLKTTGIGLYKLLMLNKDKLIVFDDSDSIWGDKDIINMMKIVTSDSGDRAISWTSAAMANVALMSKEEREEYEKEYLEALMEDPNTKMKPPSTFNFSGSMINISNMPAEKFDNAIKSRAIFINVYLAERDVLRRMATIKRLQGASDEKIKFLLTALVPDAVDALEGIGRYGGEVKYLTPAEARKNKLLNMRSLDIAEALYDAGVKNFEHMVGLYA